MARIRLTPGERLRILRRREGKTQAQAAKAMDMPLSTYKAAEAGEDTPTWEIAVGEVGRLTDAEFCYISRRRKGLTLDDLAEQVGLSKWTICLMERGRAPIATLLDYWMTRG